MLFKDPFNGKATRITIIRVISQIDISSLYDDAAEAAPFLSNLKKIILPELNSETCDQHLDQINELIHHAL